MTLFPFKHPSDCGPLSGHRPALKAGERTVLIDPVPVARWGKGYMERCRNAWTGPFFSDLPHKVWDDIDPLLSKEESRIRCEAACRRIGDLLTAGGLPPQPNIQHKDQ